MHASSERTWPFRQGLVSCKNKNVVNIILSVLIKMKGTISFHHRRWRFVASLLFTKCVNLWSIFLFPLKCWKLRCRGLGALKKKFSFVAFSCIKLCAVFWEQINMKFLKSNKPCDVNASCDNNADMLSQKAVWVQNIFFTYF